MSKARRLELALADDQVARDEARAAGETSYTRSCLVIELFDLVYASRSRGAPTSLMMCVHSAHCVCCVWAACQWWRAFVCVGEAEALLLLTASLAFFTHPQSYWQAFSSVFAGHNCRFLGFELRRWQGCDAAQTPGRSSSSAPDGDQGAAYA